MHQVCNIRDLSLRASLPPQQMWAAYARDVERLLERAVQGGLGSVNAVQAQERRAA